MKTSNIIQAISPSEIYYIQQGVESNIRNDGRSRLDYRHFDLDIGELSQAVGSSRLILNNTHILVGVKADIVKPDPKTPNNGKLQFTVDCCPSASPEFEGKGAEFINIQLANQLERLLSNSKSMDLSALAIVPGQYVWQLSIDAIVLDSGGNLYDSLSIATRAALFNVRLPVIKVVQGEYSTVDFEISAEEPARGIPVNDVPISVTLTKIGNHFVIDSTLEEEVCMDARLIIGINKRNHICSVEKSGVAGLDANTINQMMIAAKQVGSQILKTMDDTFQQLIQ